MDSPDLGGNHEESSVNADDNWHDGATDSMIQMAQISSDSRRGGNAASLSTPSFIRECTSFPEQAQFLSRVQSIRAASYSQSQGNARIRRSTRSFREDERQNRLGMNALGDDGPQALPQERKLGKLRTMTTLVDNRQGVTKTVCEVVVDGDGECWENEKGASGQASGGGKDDIARDLHSTKQRIEKLNDLVPEDLRANHFTTKAIRLAYLLPGTIMFGFELALANNLLFQLVIAYLVTASLPPGVQPTDIIAEAFEKFPYSVGKGGDIFATSILILFSAEALSIILSITVGLLIDIWMDGSWLHTFRKIPIYLRVFLFHWLILFIPFGVFAFTTFLSFDAAMEAYQLAVIISFIVVITAYLILYMYTSVMLVLHLIWPKDPSGTKSSMSDGAMKLLDLIMLRAAQRYEWLSYIMWRVSLLCCSKETKAEEATRTGALEIGTDTAPRQQWLGCLFQLRRGWTKAGISNALPAVRKFYFQHSGDDGIADEVMMLGPSLDESSGNIEENGADDAVTKMDRAIQTMFPWQVVRKTIFVWLVFVTICGMAGSMFGAVLPTGHIAVLAVVVAAALPAIGVVALLRHRHLRLQGMMQKPDAEVRAYLTPAMRVIMIVLEALVFVVYPGAVLLGFAAMEGTAKGILQRLLPFGLFVTITYFKTLFEFDQVIRWLGPGAMREIFSNKELLHRASIAKQRINRKSVRMFFICMCWAMGIIFMVVGLFALTTNGTISPPPKDWAFDNSTDWGADAESAVTRSTATYMRNLGADHPLCGLNGGVPELSVLDYMMLSRISYYRNDSRVQPILDEYFGKDEVIFSYAENQMTGLGRYLEFYIPGSNTVVIAARGTLTWYDLLNNVAMYSEVVYIQFLVRYFVPFARTWDYAYPKVILALANFFGNSWRADNNNRMSYKRPDLGLEEFVIEAMNWPLYQNSTFVLTGHSLGGGAAIVAASRLQIQAVAFNAPNAKLAHLKFETSLEDINTWTINVMPDRDYVPMVDFPSDHSQSYHCNAPGNVMAPSLACHMPLRVTCEIEWLCGTMGRPHIADCDTLVNNDNFYF